MTRSWLWLLIAAGLFAIISLILLLVAHLWPEKLTEAEITFIGILSIFGVSYIIDILLKTKEMDERIKRATSILEQENVAESAIDSLSHLHKFIKQIGEETIKEQIKSVESRAKGFSVAGIDWAMRANAAFWRELIPRAGDERRRGRQLICYVIHSSDPRLWKESQAFNSLQEQEEFVAEGGKIERIIVGRFLLNDVKQAIVNSAGESERAFTQRMRPQSLNDDPKIEDYADVLRLMHMHKITVYYMEGTLDAFSNDYATVSIDGQQLVMRWIYEYNLGRVANCVFEETTEEELRNWRSRRAHAEPIAPLMPPSQGATPQNRTG